MFTLTKEFRFEAAHMLPHHDGKCRNLHGHSFRGRIIVASKTLWMTGPKQSMVQDFSEIKRVLDPLVDKLLDHKYLNESLPLENPTSEEIARFVYNMVKRDLPLLVAVEIDETCTSSCRYEKDEQDLE